VELSKKKTICGVNNFKSFLFLKLIFFINWVGLKARGPQRVGLGQLYLCPFIIRAFLARARHGLARHGPGSRFDTSTYKPANLQVTTAMKRQLKNGSETTGETNDRRRGSGGGYGEEMVVTATEREREREREREEKGEKDVFSNNKIQ